MVVALLVNATLMMGRSVFQGTDRNALKSIVIAGLSFFVILCLRWNVIYVILLSGALGVLFFYFGGAVIQGMAPTRPGPSVDVPAASGWRSLAPPAALAVLLATAFWLIDGTWTIFATFFKIGAFAFGGGFAAVPIIQSVVVDGMRWLDLTAFRDGIALGQITPGPVFITAAFIGYKVKGIVGAMI
jgi:chromate transporter